MEKKVVYEVRLSKPLMTVTIMAAVGLLAIGAKPLIEATPAFAQSNQVHKVALCDERGEACSNVFRVNSGVSYITKNALGIFNAPPQ